MEDRRAEVVDVDGVFRHIKTEVVGFAVGGAAILSNVDGGYIDDTSRFLAESTPRDIKIKVAITQS